MGLAAWYLKELRSSLATPEKWVTEFFGGGAETKTGVRVDEYAALNYAAFFCGVTNIAGIMMQLPCQVFRRRADGSKELMTKHPLYKIVHDIAKPKMTAPRFRQTLTGHLATWGNGYAQVLYNLRDGSVNSLHPIRPDRMHIEEDRENPAKVNYIYRPKRGPEYTFGPGELLHIPGFGYDGIQGYSIVTLARESIGFGLGTEEFGARYFGDGLHPGAVVTVKGKVRPENRQTYKDDLKKKYTGLGKNHLFVLFEQDTEIKTIGIPPEDAQFLETREFQVVEIARWLNLPVHVIKGNARETYQNVEQGFLELIIYSMGPWIKLWETELTIKLLREDERGEGYFIEFNVDGLLRGDIASRTRAYSLGRQWGWLSANDIRRKENMDPIKGGDDYLVPLNMTPAGSAERTLLLRGHRGTFEAQYRPLIEDAVGRIIRREVNDLTGAVKKYLGKRTEREFREFVDDYYTQLEEYIRKNIEPIARSVGKMLPGEDRREVIDTWMNRFVESHTRRSREMIAAMMVMDETVAAGEELPKRMSDVIGGWEETRTPLVVERELKTLMSAVGL